MHNVALMIYGDVNSHRDALTEESIRTCQLPFHPGGSRSNQFYIMMGQQANYYDFPGLMLFWFG